MNIEIIVKNKQTCGVQCLCCNRRYSVEVDATETPLFCDFCFTPCLRVLTFDITTGEVNATI
jgi:hypothetical protein